MKLDWIHPYPKNAKKHTVAQLKSLAKIVKEVGWRQPVLVNSDNVIVAGHGRYLTYETYADEYALKPIWVINDKGETLFGEPESTPLTKEQEMSYRIADNKLNESAWIDDLLQEDLQSLKDLNPTALELTGFDESVFDPIAVPDELTKQTPSRTDTRPTIKITFQFIEDMELAQTEVAELTSRYNGSYMSVSTGEL